MTAIAGRLRPPRDRLHAGRRRPGRSTGLRLRRDADDGAGGDAATATDMGANLAWSPVADAAELQRLPHRRRARVRLRQGAGRLDRQPPRSPTAACMNGRDYYYVVIPMGASADSASARPAAA